MAAPNIIYCCWSNERYSYQLFGKNANRLYIKVLTSQDVVILQFEIYDLAYVTRWHGETNVQMSHNIEEKTRYQN